MSLAITLHILSSIVWVGGMFFAYMILKPASDNLSTTERLTLWQGSFDRFFRWVWIAVVLLLATGYWMIFSFYGGMKGAGTHIHIMQLTGIIMMLTYMHVYFAPYKKLKKALKKNDEAQAEKSLNQIRMLVALNLVLGIITVAIGTGGRYF